MEKTIDGINNKNTKGYISLFDFDSILQIWKEAAREDEDFEELASDLENDKESFIETYSMSYNMVIGALERIHKLDEWHFELEAFELDTAIQDSNFITEKYIMLLVDGSKNQWSMDIYLTKYKNCYFLMEPVEYSYMRKEL